MKRRNRHDRRNHRRPRVDGGLVRDRSDDAPEGQFPLFLGTGTKNTAVVYFEIEPGYRLGTHTDSVEEILVILEGQVDVSLGEEEGRLYAGQMAVVPAMVPHGMRNVGEERVRVAGFFSSNVIVSTFDKPVMPFGQRVVGTPPVLAEEEVPTGDASA